MTAPLPLLLAPGHEETWPSYLTRRAAQHGCTLTELADSIGLRHHGQWPPYFGVAIRPETRDRLSPRLSIAPSNIEAMHLAHYDQRAFDLHGLLDNPGISTTREITARSWVWLAGSSYCPACLAEDGMWRLSWRIPWITTCPVHLTALVGRCPACDAVPGLNNKLNASAPQRVAAAPDGRRCTRPRGTGTCGTDLSAVDPEPAPQARLARATLLRHVVESGGGTVLGQRRSSLQTLTAWQAAIGICVRLGAVDADGWGRTHRQLNPPRDPAVIDQLLEAVEPLMCAPDPATGADVLNGWCRNAGILRPHALTFSRITRPSAALQPAITELLLRQGRAHALLRRTLNHPDGSPFPALGYTSQDVPQVCWPCALPERLRTSVKPDQLLLRAVLSLVLVRALDGETWSHAGDLLGIPPDKATNWTRYAFSARFGNLRQELIDSAVHVGQRLHQRKNSPSYAQRPTISGFGRTALANAQQPGCTRAGASAWCPCLGDES